MIHDWMIEFWD